MCSSFHDLKQRRVNPIALCLLKIHVPQKGQGSDTEEAAGQESIFSLLIALFFFSDIFFILMELDPLSKLQTVPPV